MEIITFLIPLILSQVKTYIQYMLTDMSICFLIV